MTEQALQGPAPRTPSALFLPSPPHSLHCGHCGCVMPQKPPVCSLLRVLALAVPSSWNILCPDICKAHNYLTFPRS